MQKRIVRITEGELRKLVEKKLNEYVEKPYRGGQPWQTLLTALEKRYRQEQNAENEKSQVPDGRKNPKYRTLNDKSMAKRLKRYNFGHAAQDIIDNKFGKGRLSYSYVPQGNSQTLPHFVPTDIDGITDFDEYSRENPDNEVSLPLDLYNYMIRQCYYDYDQHKWLNPNRDEQWNQKDNDVFWKQIFSESIAHQITEGVMRKLNEKYINYDD